MQAAVFHGEERITIEPVPIPDVGAGEALVRVVRTALCGSDLKLWHRGARFTAGHEIFGIVEQAGHSRHAQRCAIYIPVHCGHCAACRRGNTQTCLTISSLVGWDRPGGYADTYRSRTIACCRSLTTSRTAWLRCFSILSARLPMPCALRVVWLRPARRQSL